MHPTRRLLASLCVTLGMAASLPAAADMTAVDNAIGARQYDGAIALLQPLVDQGDGYATWRLAQLYLDGHGGTQAEGVTLLQRAAAAGEPDAQARLGVMYAKGNGIPQSDLEAYKWLSLAARGAAPGVSRTVAQTNNNVVAGRLTPDQRAEAEAALNAISATYQAPAPAPVTEPAASEPVAIEAAPEPIAEPPMTGFRVQLASVQKESEIDGEWARLKKRIGAPLDGLQLHVEQADLGTKGIYHRLQVGPFATHADAAAACRAVKAAGSDCLVVAP